MYFRNKTESKKFHKMYPYIETGDFPKKVLKLQRLQGVKEVKKLPQFILDKHIALNPLTENGAILKSRSRKQYCLKTGKMVVKNHVFENPEVLIKAIVTDPNWKKYYNKEIYVSEQKLNVIQSEKDKKNWTAKEIDPRHAMFADKTENYHLLTEFLSYDEIKFVGPGDKDAERANQERLPRKRRAENASKISTHPNKFSLLSEHEE
jgi:hypothetical protein